MTERKPQGVSWESWTDRQIREAQQRGDFERLPGKGKPLAGLGMPRDELWWVRRKLREEDLAYLPPTLQIRRDIEIAREQVAAAVSEHQVRRIVAAINVRIREVNRTATEGPPSSVMPLDEELALQRWRDQRSDSRPGR
ncbi:DUF1992 domain-containing protein [soil metagenome]